MKTVRKTETRKSRVTEIRELPKVVPTGRLERERASGGLLGNSGVGKTCFVAMDGFPIYGRYKK